ncbi:MAG: hydroxyethylthiazole kinase [Syntrophomonadaceae bacterium]|nr:hydroxyethylthiazole kinase [Syntrophomonadaceae bacterium]
MLKECAQIWDELRKAKPLVHCITNYVTVNDVANIILCAGGSPAMVEHPDEAGEFVNFAQALYLNLGTLGTEQENAMLLAAASARVKGVPLIVDPVACGVIPRKIQVFDKIRQNGITLIKGNAAEIKSLAGLQGLARGVDSMDSGEGLQAACSQLSMDQKAIIAATGTVDVVADSNKLAQVFNGSNLFQNITGAGCMVGGVMAACIGTPGSDPFLGSITGLLAYNIAGERAEASVGMNPGTFRQQLYDYLYNLKGEDILREAKVEWQL